jgi:multicomponent Na+:H+ antiporter subunit E
MDPRAPLPERRGTTPLLGTERLAWGRQLFVLALVAWLALQGLDRPLIGLVVILFAAAAGALIATDRPQRWRLHRLPGFALYFVLASLRGGFDVAWRALHPALPIAPRFVEVPLDLPPGQPRTLFVSVLSLMPGTLSADLEEGGRILVVHALSDQAEASVAELERRVRGLFAVETERGPT